MGSQSCLDGLDLPVAADTSVVINRSAAYQNLDRPKSSFFPSKITHSNPLEKPFHGPVIHNFSSFILSAASRPTKTPKSLIIPDNPD